MFSHPKNVCMTYVEHCKFSLNVSFLLLSGSCKSFIHAFLPNLFILSSTKLVKDLDVILKNSGCKLKNL